MTPRGVIKDEAVTGAVWPPGCDLPGCLHHYAPGRNLAAEGCICPCWFGGGGWHIISANPGCGAHQRKDRRQ